MEKFKGIIEVIKTISTVITAIAASIIANL